MVKGIPRLQVDGGDGNAMIISVFVNNLPPNIHWRWLLIIFQHHGKILDVFIPKKRSNRGRKFDFVRFADPYEARRVVQKMNGAWLMDHKIGVNLSRFNSRSFYWRRMNSDEGQEFLNLPKARVGDSNNMAPLVTKECSEDSKFSHKSYKQALLNQEDIENGVNTSPMISAPSVSVKKKSCNAFIDSEIIHRMELCVVGKAKGLFSVEWLQEYFGTQGIYNVFTKKISAKHFVIEFPDEETMETVKKRNGNG